MTRRPADNLGASALHARFADEAPPGFRAPAILALVPLPALEQQARAGDRAADFAPGHAYENGLTAAGLTVARDPPRSAAIMSAPRGRSLRSRRSIRRRWGRAPAGS